MNPQNPADQYTVEASAAPPSYEGFGADSNSYGRGSNPHATSLIGTNPQRVSAPSGKERSQANPIGKLKFFVGGVRDIPDDSIRGFFIQHCDQVVSCEQKVDSDGKRKGFGFVVCYNPDVKFLAGKRHSLDGHTFDCDEVVETKVFVGGLKGSTTHDQLLEYFEKYGNVVYIEIATDPQTGQSKNFGFVQFEDQSSAQQSLNDEETIGHHIDGRRVNVRKAQPRRRQGQRQETRDQGNSAQASMQQMMMNPAVMAMLMPQMAALFQQQQQGMNPMASMMGGMGMMGKGTASPSSQQAPGQVRNVQNPAQMMPMMDPAAFQSMGLGSMMAGQGGYGMGGMMMPQQDDHQDYHSHGGHGHADRGSGSSHRYTPY